MGMILTLDYEAEHPRTLFIMDDYEAALAHATAFCQRANLQLATARLWARAEINGRNFRWMWDWPRDNRWICNYSGMQLSTVVLHTHLARADRDWIFARIRGWPLDKPSDQCHQYADSYVLNDYRAELTNEAPRLR